MSEEIPSHMSRLKKCRCTGLIVFHFKWIIGTHGNWKNQNPRSRFRALHNYPEFEGLTVHLYLLHSCKTEHVPSFRWAKVRPFFSSLLVVLMVKPKMRSALQSKLLRVRACPSNVWPVMEFWHINEHFSKLRPQSRYPKIEWNLLKPRETSWNKL